jgi:hypothetical protein
MLQKPFWGDDRVFLGPLMRFARRDMRDHIVKHKKLLRRFVPALRSATVAEAVKNQLLRDFRRRSIFDFCNTIPPKADIGQLRRHRDRRHDTGRQSPHLCEVSSLLFQCRDIIRDVRDFCPTER